MTLQDIVDMLKRTELKQLSIKTDTETVIDYINLGILELYKRFPVETREEIVELQEGVDVYTMPDDYMYIVAAYDEVPEGSPAYVHSLPINEEDNIESVNTVSYNKVQVPLRTDGAYISIIYVAYPPVYEESMLADEVMIPRTMLEALTAYVGYKGKSSIDNMPQGENNVHYRQFEIACDKIDRLGVFSRDDLGMTDRVNNRGFI